MSTPAPALAVFAVDGVGEVGPGADLVELLLTHLATALVDGDVVVVTSKVVSKADGLLHTSSRAGLLAAETDRVVARRGPTSIVRTHSGLTIAMAGIDQSNVETGRSATLPPDPDASARGIRASLATRTGLRLGVVITDTAGRAWRTGQTDLAIGVAGLTPLHDLSGRRDGHGNMLAVTAPAIADEVAAATELVRGKLARRPFAVVRGLAEHVLAPDDDGPGATALIRPEPLDLFGWGATEAVQMALARDEGFALRGFATAVGAVRELVEYVVADVRTPDAVSVRVKFSTHDEAIVSMFVRADATPTGLLEAGASRQRLTALLRAHRLSARPVEAPVDAGYLGVGAWSVTPDV